MRSLLKKSLMLCLNSITGILLLYPYIYFFQFFPHFPYSRRHHLRSLRPYYPFHFFKFIRLAKIRFCIQFCQQIIRIYPSRQTTDSTDKPIFRCPVISHLLIVLTYYIQYHRIIAHLHRFFHDPVRILISFQFMQAVPYSNIKLSFSFNKG